MNTPRGFSEHPAGGSSAPVDGPPAKPRLLRALVRSPMTVRVRALGAGSLTCRDLGPMTRGSQSHRGLWGSHLSQASPSHRGPNGKRQCPRVRVSGEDFGGHNTGLRAPLCRASAQRAGDTQQHLWMRVDPRATWPRITTHVSLHTHVTVPVEHIHGNRVLMDMPNLLRPLRREGFRIACSA